MGRLVRQWESKLRLPGCSGLFATVFAFVLVWSFTTSHINVNWYSVPFLNFFNFFFLLNNSTSNLLHLTMDFLPVHTRTYFIPDMRYALSSAFSIFIHPPLKSYLPVTAYF